MKIRTLIAHHRYFGVDALQLRTAAGRVLTRSRTAAEVAAGAPAKLARRGFERLRT